MNLFWKKMFGSLQSTAKTEAKEGEGRQTYESEKNGKKSKES